MARVDSSKPCISKDNSRGLTGFKNESHMRTGDAASGGLIESRIRFHCVNVRWCRVALLF